MAKEELRYSDTLEARSQRGERTHQKDFALSVRKQKEFSESKKNAKTRKNVQNATNEKEKTKEGDKK